MYVKEIDCTRIGAKDQFAESLKNTGFAVLRTPPHWFDQELLKKVYALWADFFASDRKFLYAFKEETQRGYFPFRSENAKSSYKKDLKEFFHIYRNDHIPEDAFLPTIKLFHQFDQVAGMLLEVLEERLPKEIREKLSESLVKMAEKSDSTLLRVLHYPPLTDNTLNDGVRAAAHEDINLITLLPVATQPGLEVRDLNGKWHTIEGSPGSLVVNVGDMLQEATSKYYVSTLHRVENPSGEAAKLSRYSLPFFVHARSDVKLSDRYTAQQYLHERA